MKVYQIGNHEKQHIIIHILIQYQATELRVVVG